MQPDMTQDASVRSESSGERRWWWRYRSYLAPAVATVLSIPALLAIYIDPSRRTIIVATLFVGMLFWSTVTRRWKTPVKPALTPEAQAAQVRADLKRTLGWVALFPVGVFLASLLKFSALSTAGMEEVFPRIVAKAQAGGPTTGGLVMTLVVMLIFAQRAFQLWLQLRRIEAGTRTGSSSAA